MPSFSGNENGNERELANTEPSVQSFASQERVNLQHNIGPRRRRRHDDTNDEEDCSPIVGSGAKDEDVVRRARGKRRRVNTSALTTRGTAPKRQSRLRCDSPKVQSPAKVSAAFPSHNLQGSPRFRRKDTRGCFRNL
jgi:hypothetical protein